MEESKKKIVEVMFDKERIVYVPVTPENDDAEYFPSQEYGKDVKLIFGAEDNDSDNNAEDYEY